MLREAPIGEFIVQLNERDRGLIERVEKKLNALAIALGRHDIAHLDSTGQMVVGAGYDGRCNEHGLNVSERRSDGQ